MFCLWVTFVSDTEQQSAVCVIDINEKTNKLF